MTGSVAWSATPPNPGSNLIKATTSACLVMLATASLVLVSTMGPLPLSYFMLVSAAAATLLIEILVLPSFGNRESAIVLLQLSMVMAFSKLAETFRFASIPGYDTYAHRAAIHIVLQSGHLDLTLGASSGAFPALTFLQVQFVQIAAIDERVTFALTSMLGVVAIILFFLLARLFIAPRWAMVAAVVLSAAPFFKWWTEVEVSPTTIGILLAFLMLYSFLKATQHRSVSLWILGVAAMAGIIISHPIITLFALWTMLSVGAVQVLGGAGHSRVRSLAGTALLMAVATVTYWMYLNGEWEVSVTLFSSVLTSGSGYFPLRPTLGPTPIERFWGDLPWVVLLVGAVYSGLVWVRRPRQSALKVAWVVMSVGVAAVTGASLIGGGVVAAFSNRWLLLLEIAACLPFANSLRVLASQRGLTGPVLALAIASVVLAASSVSPVVSLYHGGHNPLLAFSEGETDGMAFGTNCTQPVVTDSYSATYLHFTYKIPTADLYGYSIGLPLNFPGACILLQSGSSVVYSKTSRGATELSVDYADFAPGTAQLPSGFPERLASEWNISKVYDDGDASWFYYRS